MEQWRKKFNIFSIHTSIDLLFHNPFFFFFYHELDDIDDMSEQ